MGKTAETVVFPASNDSTILSHISAKSTGKIHNFGGKPIISVRFLFKSIQIHLGFTAISRDLTRFCRNGAESGKTA